jgi:hypothetical protein
MNGRPNIHKMRPKDLSFARARKWYVLVVIVVVTIWIVYYFNHFPSHINPPFV